MTAGSASGRPSPGASPVREVDVVVVGSGAAGLTAAVVAAERGCTVEILEKSDLVGGTSAFSGGMVWIPLNHHQGAAVDDDREAAIAYIRSLTQGREPDPELIEVFVDRAAEAIEFVESHTGVELQVAESWSDYYADRDGGLRFGRSLDNRPIEVRDLLGDWYERMRRGPHMPATLTEDEVATFGHNPDPRGHSQEGGIDFAALSAARADAGVATMGQALVAGLLKGVLDRDAINVTTGAPVRRLVTESGAVVGVVAEGRGGETTVRARRGVLLACGGFEWNPAMVQAFLGVPDVMPMSPPGNDGDGHQMAIELGARLANMTMGWGLPVTYDGRSALDGAPLANPNVPRHHAGAIMVNGEGRRFINEGVSYQEFQKVFRTFDPAAQRYPNEPPVWVLFDQRVRGTVFSGDFVPDGPVPAWVKHAPTIAELAVEIDVDPGVLVEEVARWNANVAGGSDPDFGRGTVWTEGWTTGGPDPASALAPVGDGPYYAMPVYDGYLGTSGGVLLDGDARVRAARGGVIEGLYAAGNVAASVFGPAYPGGGSSLCQGITFGYLAAQHMSSSVPTTERTPR